MKILNIKWSAISLLIIVCVFSVWYFFPEAKKQPQCTDRAEYIHVKLGEHVFAVPWKESWLYLKYGDKTIDTYKACYQVGDPPIEVTYFSFSPHHKAEEDYGWFYRKYASDEILKKTREGFALGVSAFLVDHNLHYAEHDLFFRSVEPRLKESNKKMELLPIEGYFYVFQSPPAVYYIATEKKFITPSGNPVSFACGSFMGHTDCASGIVWKDNIILGFDNLSKTYVPPSRLKEFYYDFLNYMESLEVKNQETNNQITGTQP